MYIYNESLLEKSRVNRRECTARRMISLFGKLRVLNRDFEKLEF